MHADRAAPAVSLYFSALDDDEDDVVAAAMLCSWAWAAGVVDAADGGRNVVQVQDELWLALRAAPGLVERSDRIHRLGRHRSVVSFHITHSLDDLEALPTESDRARPAAWRPRRDLPDRTGRTHRGAAALTHPVGVRIGGRAAVAA